DTVLKLLEELGAHTIPMLTVYNKRDLLDEYFIPLNHPYIHIEAFKREDIKRLMMKIEETLKETWEPYDIQINPDQGKTLHRLGRETIVTDRYFNEVLNQYVVIGLIRFVHSLLSFINT